MKHESLLILVHQSPLRAVTEAEALSTLTDAEEALPRRVEKIDTRALNDHVEGHYWRSSHVFIREEAARIRALADECAATEIRYLGIAEVPHLLALGAYLGDERLVRVRDYDRDRNSWEWPSAQGTLEVITLNGIHEVVSQAGAAVLRVEISYPVKDEDVDAAIGKERLADIRIVPRDRAPAPALVRSEEDVARVRMAVRDAFAALAHARPDADVIHLFIAAPVSVCLAVGQELRLRNGKDVQTYRYRSGSADGALTEAIRLTSGDVREASKSLTAEERARARSLRPVWQAALEDVRAHAESVRAQLADHSWFASLRPQEALRTAAPFPGLKPMWQLIQQRDVVSDEAGIDEFEFDKDTRAWRLSDELVLSMFDAAGRDERRLREHARLFFWHEYVHDGQALTAYTSEDVGRLPNCLERIDYMADVYAICHQVDFLAKARSDASPPESSMRDSVIAQIEVALRSFWAFEPPAPVAEMQERRLRRYLNWYWRRVQIRDSVNLAAALTLLAHLPCIEISGLRHRLAGERNFVMLYYPGGHLRLHVGLVLDNGRFRRFGSSTDLNLEELLLAFSRHDQVAINRFFNALSDHVK